MKNIIHQSTGKLIMGATLLLAIGGSFANAETVMLEFRVANDNVANAAVEAAGFLPVYHANYLYEGPSSNNTKHNYAQWYLDNLVASLNTSVGDLTITITGASGNAFGGHKWQGGINEPAEEEAALYTGATTFTGEGIYFNTTDLPFTIAGFHAGDQISVYALGSNAASSARVTIGSETNHAIAVGYSDGNAVSPTIDNFTLINATPFTVGDDGLLTGLFSNNSSGAEGRLSGMILVVTPIPEPSTWALIVTGVALLAVLRRRQLMERGRPAR
jgi:hypothetical protein